jgi:hypothetical protein
MYDVDNEYIFISLCVYIHFFLLLLFLLLSFARIVVIKHFLASLPFYLIYHPLSYLHSLML